MSEKRFSYNPFSKDYVEGGTSHSIALYNRGKQKQFDEYIRGILLDGILYLRLYYPFDDLGELSAVELQQRSRELLEKYREEILFTLDRNNINYIVEIKYNVKNDLLAGVGLANV